MRVSSVSNTTFGLRKLTSFQDLAKQRGGKINRLDSRGMRGYVEYLKTAVINIKKNTARAIESAKKVFIR